MKASRTWDRHKYSKRRTSTTSPIERSGNCRLGTEEEWVFIRSLLSQFSGMSYWWIWLIRWGIAQNQWPPLPSAWPCRDYFSASMNGCSALNTKAMGVSTDIEKSRLTIDLLHFRRLSRLLLISRRRCEQQVDVPFNQVNDIIDQIFVTIQPTSQVEYVINFCPITFQALAMRSSGEMRSENLAYL